MYRVSPRERQDDTACARVVFLFLLFIFALLYIVFLLLLFVPLLAFCYLFMFCCCLLTFLLLLFSMIPSNVTCFFVISNVSVCFVNVIFLLIFHYLLLLLLLLFTFVDVTCFCRKCSF